MQDVGEILNIVVGIATVGMSYGIVKTHIEGLREAVKRLEIGIEDNRHNKLNREQFNTVLDSLKDEIKELKHSMKEILVVLNAKQDRNN